MRVAWGQWVLLSLLFVMPAMDCHGGDCFIGRPGFAVIEPSLIERVCYLYGHERRAYKPGAPDESAGVVLPTNLLHPDPLHLEFVQLRLENKYLPLAVGTRVFNCQYDMETIKRDRDEAALKGYVMPEFACNGFLFQMVPIRLENSNICHWVAEALVRCDEQIKFKVTPFDLFEAELRAD